MSIIPEIGIVARDLLRTWDLPGDVCEFARLLGSPSQGLSASYELQARLVRDLNVAFDIRRAIHRSADGAMWFEVDTVLMSLAVQYAALKFVSVIGEQEQGNNSIYREILCTVLDQIGVAYGKRNSDELRFDALASFLVERTRSTLLPAVKQLGSWQLKRDLEDLCLQIVNPERFRDVKLWLEDFANRNRHITNWVEDTLREHYTLVSPNAQVEISFCGIEGAHRRLKQFGGPENSQLLDYAVVKVVVPTIEECYSSLGVLHGVGLPQPGTFRDRISTPENNGFSCLLSTVSLSPDFNGSRSPAIMLDVMVQTPIMSTVSQIGAAQHDCYAALSRGVTLGTAFPRPISEERCIYSLVATLCSAPASTVTVFTTKRGEPQTVGAGATVLDVAYKIHSEVGNRAIGGMINGKPVELSRPVTHGCLVEIILPDESEPSEGVRKASDLDFVRERSSKRHIRRFLNRSETEKGRHLLSLYLRGRNVYMEEGELDRKLANLVHRFRLQWGCHSVRDIYELIARAASPKLDDPPAGPRVTAKMVGSELLKLQHQQIPGLATALHTSPAVDWLPAVVGQDYYGSPLSFRLCGICRPTPAERSKSSFVGTRSGTKVTVHVATCRHLRASRRSTLSLEWQQITRSVKCVIEVQALDRALLTRDITEAVFRHSCGLEEIHAKALEFGQANVVIHVYASNAVAVVKLMQELETVRSVQRLRLKSTSLPASVKARIQRGPLDRELMRELQGSGYGSEHSVLVNRPSVAQRTRDVVVDYTPTKPTYSSDIFFGRESDTIWLLEQTLGSSLYAGGMVHLHGSKRVGKTSLALRFLDRAERQTRTRLIRVDLRTFYNSTSVEVLEHIGQKIGKEISADLLLGTTVDRALTKVEEQLSKSTLKRKGIDHVVLILDELGGPLHSYAEGHLGPEFLHFLNGLMDLDVQLSTVLITPAYGIHLMEACRVWSVLRSMPARQIGILENEAAELMITRPFRAAGVRIGDLALSKISHLSGNHPWYVILLLKEIASIVNKSFSKDSVTASDVEQATTNLVARSSAFQFFFDEEQSVAHAQECMRVLARLKQSGGNYKSAEELRQALATGGTILPAADLNSILKRLEHDQIIAMKQDPAGLKCKFLVPLFEHWLLQRPDGSGAGQHNTAVGGGRARPVTSAVRT